MFILVEAAWKTDIEVQTFICVYDRDLKHILILFSWCKSETKKIYNLHTIYFQNEVIRR